MRLIGKQSTPKTLNEVLKGLHHSRLPVCIVDDTNYESPLCASRKARWSGGYWCGTGQRTFLATRCAAASAGFRTMLAGTCERVVVDGVLGRV